MFSVYGGGGGTQGSRGMGEGFGERRVLFGTVSWVCEGIANCFTCNIVCVCVVLVALDCSRGRGLGCLKG